MERVIQVLTRMRDDALSVIMASEVESPLFITSNHTKPTISTFSSRFQPLQLVNPDSLPLKEGVMSEDWPVQFIPAGESTQAEALLNAQNVRYGDFETRIFWPVHLAAELLRSGRLKDYVRVEALIQCGQMDMDIFHHIVRRHNLSDKWRKFSKAAE